MSFVIHPGGPLRPSLVTLTSNPSCSAAGPAMMSSWLCHISCDHVRPQGILAGYWRTERPGRRLDMGIGEANEPEKGKGGPPPENGMMVDEKYRGTTVHLPPCQLSGSQLKQMLHVGLVTHMLQRHYLWGENKYTSCIYIYI